MELFETDVTSAFANWLSANGWTVKPYAAQRVPARIREQLRISIYTVDENRHVKLLGPT